MEEGLQRMKKHQVYLGLGSNLGDKQHQLLTAIRLIGERVGTVTRQSAFIESEPWGFRSDNRFLNAVILTETTHTPRQVLELTQQIERDMGRHKPQRSYEHSAPLPTGGRKDKVQRPAYSDRPIDIDILLYDDLSIDEPDLQIPHPLMQERDFVMRPLEEIRGKEVGGGR